MAGLLFSKSAKESSDIKAAAMRVTTKEKGQEQRSAMAERKRLLMETPSLQLGRPFEFLRQDRATARC